MGYGAWSRNDFMEYSARMNRKLKADGSLAGDYKNQEVFRARDLDPMLDPRDAVRECCDSAEHPETLPVILALDVTGSMGQAAVEVAKKLNVIMTRLYEQVNDIQFMVMGIGDFAYDRVPLQASQFEADIRIAEQLDRLFFEFGGGGNRFESYTAAWYFAAYHTRLDAWKRGKKGVLITMGDERLNPYIPRSGNRTDFRNVTGDLVQADLETGPLYEEVRQKYEVYHMNVIHRAGMDGGIKPSWRKHLDKAHYLEVNLDSIADEITGIVTREAGTEERAGKGLFGLLPEKAADGIAW